MHRYGGDALQYASAALKSNGNFLMDLVHDLRYKWEQGHEAMRLLMQHADIEKIPDFETRCQLVGSMVSGHDYWGQHAGDPLVN